MLTKIVNGVEVVCSAEEETEIQNEWVVNEQLKPIKAAEQAERNRKAAYITEADPLFFKAQRGEATMEEWQAKVAEIKARFPK